MASVAGMEMDWFYVHRASANEIHTAKAGGSHVFGPADFYNYFGYSRGVEPPHRACRTQLDAVCMSSTRTKTATEGFEVFVLAIRH